MLLASALPRSRAETSLLGAASAGLKERAAAAASQRFHDAKDVAVGVMGDVAELANERGLSVEGLQSAAQDFGERVRKVAENATTTALELPADTRTHAE